MTDEYESDTGLRRRAALLLLMLAVVAVLFVVVLSVLLDSSGGDGNSGAAPDDTLLVSPSAPASTSGSRTSTSAAAPRTTTRASSTSAGPSTKSCPTQQTCALRGDYGKAIDAINAYRTKNGQKTVPGRVSKQAQDCAKNNGSGCSGGWAETQVPSIDGEAAVQKIARLGKLLDPMKSFEVGWAYSPQAKQYYFAIVRND